MAHTLLVFTYVYRQCSTVTFPVKMRRNKAVAAGCEFTVQHDNLRSRRNDITAANSHIK